MSTDSNIDWNSVIKKEAVGTGGIDLGTIYGVENAYIITQKGLRDKKRYHIPKSLVENFDGIVLRLKVNESEMLKYEKTEDKKYENNASSFKSLYKSKDIETTIPLMAENLKVTKNIAEDNLNITKEPIRETKTVQVKLTHEEILIERRPVKEDSYSYITSMQSSEEKPLSLSPIE
jgi:stress response protein YsnF